MPARPCRRRRLRGRGATARARSARVRDAAIAAGRDPSIRLQSLFPHASGPPSLQGASTTGRAQAEEPAIELARRTAGSAHATDPSGAVLDAGMATGMSFRSKSLAKVGATESTAAVPATSVRMHSNQSAPFLPGVARWGSATSLPPPPTPEEKAGEDYYEFPPRSGQFFKKRVLKPGSKWRIVQLMVVFTAILRAQVKETADWGREALRDYWDDNVYKHIIATKPCWVLLPSHTLRRIHEPFMLIPLIYIAITVPIRIFMGVDATGFWEGVDIVIYAVFIFDLIMNFVSAYMCVAYAKRHGARRPMRGPRVRGAGNGARPPRCHPPRHAAARPATLRLPLPAVTRGTML